MIRTSHANLDSWTSAQRMAAVREGHKPDRVPLLGFVNAYAARISNVPLDVHYAHPEISVRNQILAADLHGYEFAPAFGWADWGAWEFGGRLQYPTSYRESAPHTLESPVSAPGDVEKIQVPDVRNAGCYPNLMQFNRICRDMGFGAKILGGSVTNVVGAMVGKQNLLRWYRKEKEALHLAYDKAAELIIRGADLVIEEFGAEASFGYGAPLDSNDLISPEVFETFAWPRLKQVHQAMLDRGITRFGAHICGDHRENLPLWAALPWPDRSTISVGAEMDLEHVAEAFDHRHIVAGNVSTSILASGTYQEVMDDARRCIEKGKNLPGGFALMPACEMPVLTPPVNVHALIAAVREYGRYE